MISVLGIPFDANSSFLRGAALAPARIRLMDTEGSANSFSELGSEIKDELSHKDLGDLKFESADPAKAFDIIKNAIGQELASHHKVLSLGGDHSVSFPIIDAYSEHYSDLHVLHLDAHTDLYDNFENNPYSHASPFARLMEKGKIKSLTQVGIRTLTNHQRDQAKRFHVKIIEMKDFNFDFINQLQGPLYLSLDLDVLDPAFAPGVSHHESGGMTVRELIHIIHQIKVPLVGADLVEYNPVRDHQNRTAMVSYKMMKELIHALAASH